MKNYKVSGITLGCKVNQYETDAILKTLSENNFEVLQGYVFADIYVVNTCAVTHEAERKSRQAINRLKKLNSDCKIYICGCASQNNPSQFKKDCVCKIVGTDCKMQLANIIINEFNTENCKNNCVNFDLKGNKIINNSEKNLLKTNCEAVKNIVENGIVNNFPIKNFFEETNGTITSRTRHFLKIQDGCNNFCSYCIIPYLRGRERSRSLKSIKNELDSLKDFTKEIVLTGINLSSYGRDSNESLTYLIKNLTNYDFRFRFGSLEVRIIDDEFLKATKLLKNFCPHFHLSLQSGDDEVLKSMNRHYTTLQYKNAVDKIRKYYPNAGITTDIIVGFPTETKQQFENCKNFAREIGFSDIHVFSYSSRKGTIAGNWKQLNPELINDRQKQLSKIKIELINQFLISQVGIEQTVLFETYEDGLWCGHALNYIKVYCKHGGHNIIKKVIPNQLYKDGVIVE